MNGPPTHGGREMARAFKPEIFPVSKIFLFHRFRVLSVLNVRSIEKKKG
jgi:hypothetical protein